MTDAKRRPRPATQYGPTAETVAANVQRLRKARGMTIYELSGKLKKETDRAITPSAVAKIERRERQVTVDDLMALAVALRVPPSALLLPLKDSPAETIPVTGAGDVPADVAWDWMDGKRPLVLPEGDEFLPGIGDNLSALYDLQLYGRPPRRRGEIHGYAVIAKTEDDDEGGGDG